MVTRIGPRRPIRHYLREWRELRGYSQEALAARMDTSGATISRKENNKRPPKVEDLAWFADALDCEPGDLLRDPSMPTADELLRRADPAIREQVLGLLRLLKTG